jgi:hypothetical protein
MRDACPFILWRIQLPAYRSAPADTASAPRAKATTVLTLHRRLFFYFSIFISDFPSLFLF